MVSTSLHSGQTLYDLLHIKQPDTLLEIDRLWIRLSGLGTPAWRLLPTHPTFPQWVIRTSTHVEEHHRSCLGGVLRGGCRPSLLHCSLLMHDCWWPLGSSLGQLVSSFVTGLIPALFTWCTTAGNSFAKLSRARAAHPPLSFSAFHVLPAPSLSTASFLSPRRGYFSRGPAYAGNVP